MLQNCWSKIPLASVLRSLDDGGNQDQNYRRFVYSKKRLVDVQASKVIQEVFSAGKLLKARNKDVAVGYLR
jgi:hypothetical protein